MINYFYDCYRILNKVYSDKAFIKQAILDVDIEEKNRALTIKTVYGVLDRDIELSYVLSKMANKSPKLAIRTILKISMYCIKYLEKKPYAVIDNAVELTKKLGKSGASGFVNAFLRKYSNTFNNIELPKEKNKMLSIKYSYPQFLVDKLLKYYGEERTISILSSPYPTNYLSFYDIDGKDYLEKNNVSYENTVFNNVFSVKNFVRNDDYDRGLYTYQSIGSVAICDIVEPCESLLDCCSAPGGKSVRLSYKCKNVVSLDIHAHRVELVKDYANRMKRNNISAYIQDATLLNKEYIDKFDGVLCDSPCSGTGVINDNPDIKLNREENNILELTKTQIKILSTCSKYVKMGGNLYYSTCSILNEENIDIVNNFLKENDNFIIEKINSPLNHQDVNGANLFLPDISCGVGFFVAKLKRIK